MPILYRYIKYNFKTQEDLDRQMNKSLAEGIHQFPSATITIKDSTEDKCEKGFLDYTVNTPVHYPPCIRKEDVEESRNQDHK